MPLPEETARATTARFEGRGFASETARFEGRSIAGEIAPAGSGSGTGRPRAVWGAEDRRRNRALWDQKISPSGLGSPCRTCGLSQLRSESVAVRVSCGPSQLRSESVAARVSWARSALVPSVTGDGAAERSSQPPSYRPLLHSVPDRPQFPHPSALHFPRPSACLTMYL